MRRRCLAEQGLVSLEDGGGGAQCGVQNEPPGQRSPKDRKKISETVLVEYM